MSDSTHLPLNMLSKYADYKKINNKQIILLIKLLVSSNFYGVSILCLKKIAN